MTKGRTRHLLAATVAGALALSGCGGGGGAPAGGGQGGSAALPAPAPTPPPAPPPPITGVQSSAVASFASPWAMVFLSDGRILVTERNSETNAPGRLTLVAPASSARAEVAGLPANRGVLDVALHPQFAANRLVYFTFLEPGGPDEPRVGRNAADAAAQPMGLALAAGEIEADFAGGPRLANVRTLWRQTPKIVSHPGSGEPGGRMAFSPDGLHLFITAGDRQEFEPVQDLANTLGKVVRLFADGTVPPDNPFAARPGARPENWTLGHRNHYGLAFDTAGRLWSHEQGPKGGDEFNLIQSSANYGWPRVSNGNSYDDGVIPDHAPGDGFFAPALSWTPVIAPSGMIFYTGTLFGAWRGDAIIAGLQSRGLVRVRVDGSQASEQQRIAMAARIREVEQGPDGAIWVLEDGPAGGRLLRLTPVF